MSGPRRPARRGRAWRRAAWAAALLAAIGTALVSAALLRRPSLEPYAPLLLPGAAASPGSLRVRFAGVSTLVFDDGETAWMTDGFFSRPGRAAALFGRIAPDEAAIERELARLGVSRLAAVVPVHSHYDHAMDAPRVAERTGALLVGSASTLNVGRGLGLPEDRMREVKPGDSLQLGRFRLVFIASRHVPTPATRGATAETIDAPLQPPAHATAWREGQTWSIFVEHDGRRLLVQGSAGFVPGALSEQRAETVFLGVGTLGRQSEAYRAAYWREVVQAVQARRVIPIHWDDFWRPLTEPLQALPLLLDDLGRTLDDLAARSTQGEIELRMPPAFVPFDPWRP